MADQTVRIENMPLAGSNESVAFELWKLLRDHHLSPDEQLAFYVKCRDATYGQRPKAG